MAPTVAIAMSGGVDSLVSAYLLSKESNPVIGIHFLTGYEDAEPNAPADKPSALVEAALDLGIIVHVVPLQKEFQRFVVQPFMDTYLEGKTPNPCMLCNPSIKFGALLDHARKKLGADYIATGHYARASHDHPKGARLYKGTDTKKDQSYFLGFLKPHQIDSAIFPLGSMTKEEVKAVARDTGLARYTKPESQETCFITDDRYRRFLESQPGFVPRPGDIVDVAGQPIGSHQGVFAYTIGQRRGINIPAPEAYYVKKIDPITNQVMVGGKQDLLSETAEVHGINWIVEPPSSTFQAYTRIRYRHKEAPSTITLISSTKALVRFEEPQSAVTPGQGAVFYDNDLVLGAGWIT